MVLVPLFIALKIVAYDYLPGGDLRRHVAKPFADKPYTSIVVLRPDYTVDHSPGWEWLLTALHRYAGWGKDALVSFSTRRVAVSVSFPRRCHGCAARKRG